VLGRALVPRLLGSGAQVRALVRSPERAAAVLPGDVDIRALDILDSRAGEQLPGMLDKCDAVVHAATAIPADASAPGGWVATARLRIEGTQRLLAAAQLSGVRRYIQQSIATAYPDRGDQWIDEQTPLDEDPARNRICGPVREMEAMVRATSAERLGWCILRGGTFVGAGTVQERTIVRLRNADEPIVCGGRHFLPLVHVGDVAQAFALALERAPAGSVFNVNDMPIRQSDYLTRLAALVGAGAPCAAPLTACPPSLRCSNSRAVSILGWEPTHGIWPDLSPRRAG
jgi:nucleoside-diphosphate-sugar epimerase